MAASSYIGVSNVARKNKAIYIGVSDVARKITKAYVGVGGLARLCYSSNGIMPYIGTATPLIAGRNKPATASIGNYAIFAGGFVNGSESYTSTTTVDAYNDSLVRVNPEFLASTRGNAAGATISNHAIIAGGRQSRLYDSAATEAYDASLTRSVVDSGLSESRREIGTAVVGDYAIFAGGTDGYTADVRHDDVDAFSSSLTRTIAEKLSVYRSPVAGASIGGYALFAGGSTYDWSKVYDTVDAYSYDLTRMTATPLSVARANLKSAHAGAGLYALFAGGSTKTDGSADVEAYDMYLTRTTITPLPSKYGPSVGVTAGNYAMFVSNNTYDIPYVVAYDERLTQHTLDNLTNGHQPTAAATVGKYALIAAGSDNDVSYSAMVEAYQFTDK